MGRRTKRPAVAALRLGFGHRQLGAAAASSPTRAQRRRLRLHCPRAPRRRVFTNLAHGAGADPSASPGESPGAMAAAGARRDPAASDPDAATSRRCAASTSAFSLGPPTASAGRRARGWLDGRAPARSPAAAAASASCAAFPSCATSATSATAVSCAAFTSPSTPRARCCCASPSTATGASSASPGCTSERPCEVSRSGRPPHPAALRRRHRPRRRAPANPFAREPRRRCGGRSAAADGGVAGMHRKSTGPVSLARSTPCSACRGCRIAARQTTLFTGFNAQAALRTTCRRAVRGSGVIAETACSSAAGAGTS